MIVGRSAERHRIDALLGAARAGSSGVLVVRGEAGIGKSALLGYGRDQAQGMTCLAMSGVESEAELAFAGLTELLRPVMDSVAALPAPQADALHSALALRAEPANQLAVRAALLTLLAALAESSPVLVTVDDAQWVDQSSLEALAFAARRLGVEPVAVLVAVRGDEPVALGADPSSQLALGGLSDEDARALLLAHAGPAGADADHLLRVAAGNPLALLELPAVVGPVPLADGVEPPPVGPRVNQAFRRRLDRLPDDSRLAVGVVAADGSAGLGEVLAALGLLGLAPDALTAAEDAGLVRITDDGDRVELRHPLLRPVAYHALTAPDRRRAHQALGEILAAPGQFERRTWHRAAAALGPDEAVAEALEQVALAAERRGALATTAHGFARAARLSADDDERARRFLASAVTWVVSGRWEIALETLELAAACAVDPGLQADIAASTGQLEAYRAGPEKGSEILVAAADRIEADDPGRATRLLAYAVNVAVFAGDVGRATALADRAVATGARAGGLHQISGALARIEAGLLAGDNTVVAPLEAIAEMAEALLDSDLAENEHVFSLVVLTDFVRESWDRADRLLDVMVRRARDSGRLFLLALALAVRGELDFRRGRWAEAYATVTTEIWETPLDFPGVGSWLHAVQARVEAGLGLVDDARSHGSAALAAATATGTHAVSAFAGASLGFLELGQGRPQAAIEHLSQVAATFERGGVAEPGILWWTADLVEAHWRVGDIGAARRRLEVFQAQADATGRVWALAAAARSAGLLASSSDEVEAAFAVAAGWHARLDTPFEEARTLLCLGERRRELGHASPDVPLGEALSTFDRLGAAPWSAQARRLLGASPVSAESPSAPLTRQERQVAALVGGGATNREAAEQLFLSPRTIDFHLRNIYKKLQVRSRTELAIRLTANPQ